MRIKKSKNSGVNNLVILQSCNSNEAFTLVEVIVVVALIVIVSLTALVGLSDYRAGQNLRLATNEIFSVIKDVQNRSITQKDGKRWGLRFTNAEGGAQTYETFSGASYATSNVDRLYSPARSVRFGEPGVSSTADTVFSAITGKLSANKVISLITGRRDGLVSDLVLRKEGPITVRHDKGVDGYWHFDENASTTTYDASGFANAGALINGPAWQAASNCKAGTCLSFDGVNDYVDAGSGSNLNITRALTLSFWIKRTTAIGSFDSIISKGKTSNTQKQYAIDITSNNFRFGDEAGVVRGSTVISNGQWYHVVGVYTGNGAFSGLSLYVNGVAESLTNIGIVDGIESGEGSNLFIGQKGNSTEWFNGLIDEVRIYNRALSETEIQNLYNDLK